LYDTTHFGSGVGFLIMSMYFRGEDMAKASRYAAIAVDIARNVTMLGPIIAQRHQQLLSKFGSVGTVWRKLFENPKAQCLLGCLSQFGFGGTGSLDYSHLEQNVDDACRSGAGSCEPEVLAAGSSSSSSSSSSSLSMSPGTGSAFAEAVSASGFQFPPGFNLSGMGPSDLKAAAASVGISIPENFDMSALAAFGFGNKTAAAALPSASLPRPSSRTNKGHHKVSSPRTSPGSLPVAGKSN
jgi:hypothetical protein